ncbi:Multidrug resistance-associated protein 1 [Lunasporangiospora selenospora]|uniref:Multidrug resistance-associated protein 1 n=1 Tax=Lunasporangiospora selenospora TaxID=979761 RepID=A0A9P6G5I2_9FUNG|nr:Multidrug resistance-associated protein 1 [Lunasporangiospora selenospora]
MHVLTASGIRPPTTSADLSGSFVPALVAATAFLGRTWHLLRSRERHTFGRTNLIYWSSQGLMLAAAAVQLVRAGLIGREDKGSPSSILAATATAVAWTLAVVLNHFEHQFEIRSSIAIQAYYFFAVIGAAISTRTLNVLSTAPTTIAQQWEELHYVYLAFICLGFIVECWPRGRTQVQQKSGASPYEKANLFSLFWFHYIQDLITTGYRRSLTPQDIYDVMPKRIKTQYCHDHLSQKWNRYLAKCREKNSEPNLTWLVMSAYGSQWVPIIAFKLGASGLLFMAPLLMDELLAFIQSYATEDPKPASLGIILSFGLFFSTLGVSLLESQYVQLSENTGLEARTALISMVYRKALRLSPSARQTQTLGEINNHMSVDAEQWSEAIPLVPLVLSIPFEICLALYMLYLQLGWAALAGLATIVLIAPIQGRIAKFFTKAKETKMEAMDNRIRLINEVLAGIKIVKLYGWESSFRKRIAEYRGQEIRVLYRLGVGFSFMVIIFSSLTLLMALSSFSIYGSIGGSGGNGGEINAQTIFVSVSLFGLLNRPIALLAHVTSELMSVIVATKRIQRFLMAEEVDDTDIERTTGLLESVDSDEKRHYSNVVMDVRDGIFAWEKEGPEVETEKQRKTREKKEMKKRKEDIKQAKAEGKPVPELPVPAEKNYGPTLKNINISVERASLTTIVGRVGQGKTSFLNALIGEMYKRQGTVQVKGTIAYVPQQAWIINATLKDNILFGKDYDQEQYDRIVFASGLEPDLKMLPAGDQTEIGERGINLSGGQKQRVSLARAAYQDADIYLLDDPLSAVDAHVDQHLWQNLIGPNGMLKDKTRLLVTHGIHHLSEVDQIVMIKDGEISETGRYQELMEAKKAFYQLIEDYSVKASNKTTENQVEIKPATETKDTNQISPSVDALNEKEQKETTTSVAKEDDDKGNLVDEEMVLSGALQWQVYKSYAKAASYKKVFLAFSLFAVIQACQIGTNTWLQNWVNVANVTTHGVAYYMGVYTVLVVCYMFLSFCAAFTIMASGGVRASERLHENLLNNVLRLPMSFFDTTPVGRIINRFSSDIYTIDEHVTWGIHDFLFCGFSLIGTIIVIAVSTPVFLVMIPPVAGICIYVQRYYMASSRAFKRIQSVTKSPMYQHFSETLSGVSTIRAMRINQRFIEENATKSDLTANAYFVWSVGNRWLASRLEGLGAFLILAASLFAVLSRDTVSPSLVGMSLSYALNITRDIMWVVRIFCHLQNELVSVERVREYSKKNQEAPNFTDVKLPENWPNHGEVRFKNYSTRYRQGMDLVLNNVSFEIQPGEKVGIVGRTGAGKSSLTLALFRIIEAANSHWARASHNSADSDADPKTVAKLAELEKVEVEEDGGSIEIDGIDISTLGLEQLRQQLAIIPQDPTLFVGTVRENLDPFIEASDDEIWEALERAHLKEYLASMPGGLSYEVTQNGENFSVGQRSLICLARALLRKTKILVLDEATAAVDVETDELIQKTIRKEFKDRTILTIAHRIKTVMDSDKILVLEKGRVEEFEAPSELLKREESLFYKLAKQAGEIA